MFFLAGPRQSGKSTAALQFAPHAFYLNWDWPDHRALLLAGPDQLTDKVELKHQKTIIFDELHKYPDWKNYLKGLFDLNSGSNFRFLITGSARLDIYKKGADSLLGRYFLYRMLPLTVSELVHPRLINTLISEPVKVNDEQFNHLLLFGGFPEPFLKHDRPFFNQWQIARQKLLFREDFLDLATVLDIKQVETLAELIRLQATQIVKSTTLASRLRISHDTVRRWLDILESLFYCFQLRPWTANVSRSLLKSPKVYLYDWSMCPDTGQRNENFVAVHLLKAIQLWQDVGLGRFGLYYVRDKEKREVDYLVTRDDAPWFLVEVKTQSTGMSQALKHFHVKLKTKHAFQVVVNAEYEEGNCFDYSHPIQVPARTLLSQLV